MSAKRGLTITGTPFQQNVIVVLLAIALTLMTIGAWTVVRAFS